MTTAQNFRESAESLAKMVMDNHFATWAEGAIFPSEMVFFLASCETMGVTRVIESGRQDGYSTAILGEWAAAGGRQVVSIDLEMDTARAAACHERLRTYPLRLLKGNAYEQVARVAREDRRSPTALLVDGPKGWQAISLMSAAAGANVVLVALHNLAEGLPTRDLFLKLGGPGIFHEVALAEGGPAWRALLERERTVLGERGAARDLHQSSLGLLRLDSATRERFARLGGSQFGLHQPRIVRALYNAGLFRAATKLYGLSYRLLGR